MSLRMRLLQLAIAVVVALGLLAILGRVSPRLARMFDVDTSHVSAVPIHGGDFELQGGDGPWRLSKHVAGRSLVLLYFGFTRCPDLCPNTLGALARAVHALEPNQRARVGVVFISVDYRSDTPAMVARYAGSFGEEFVGLTGSKAQLDAVVAQYSSFYSFTELPASSLKYTVNHPGTVYFLEPGGQVVDQVLVEGHDAELLEQLKRHL